ncbi:MAG: aminoglycoside 3'-phosphotransferase [Clostridia bacterium]|nr:aminoglycoside 3'-phosphotransferase [Clostridia bacterium]
MKRTLIDRLPTEPPEDIRRLISGGVLYDSSSSPEARVYFIDKDEGYYLKTAPVGTLRNEAEMTTYFYGKGLAPEILTYISGERDWLLIARAQGEDCTSPIYISDPKRLCDTTAQLLRALHETDFEGCPVADRMKSYFALAESNYKSGSYDTSHFPDNFGYATAEEAYLALQSGKDALNGRVLLHGDYCLPNIMLDNWRLSGFIDLGGGGVGDRHIDVFWGVWSLGFNLGTDKYNERFKDAYGRDKINEELLRTVAAAEVFG